MASDEGPGPMTRICLRCGRALVVERFRLDSDDGDARAFAVAQGLPPADADAFARAVGETGGGEWESLTCLACRTQTAERVGP